MFTTIIILSEYNKSCTTALHLLRMLNWEITWLGNLYIFLLLRIFARSIFNVGPASAFVIISASISDVGHHTIFIAVSYTHLTLPTKRIV